MYQIKRFNDTEQSPLYYDKRLSFSFSRVIIVQNFETVTFYVLFVYKQAFSVIFCLGLVSVTRQMPQPRHKNKAIIRLSHPSR